MAAKDKLKAISDLLRINPVSVERKLTSFIEKKVRDAKAKGAVLGMSGGIDSSVVAALCAKALEPKNVLGLWMPESKTADPQDAVDAREVAEKLGIVFKTLDITSALEGIRKSLVDYVPEAKLANANMRPRLRMLVLYYYANTSNRLVVGCGNKSELRTGYFTKYGDGASDMLPIGSLYKTQVRQLANHLGIPRRIVDKVPTAGLWGGQTDESDLGLQYKDLDRIFAGLDIGLKLPEIFAATGVALDKIKGIVERERGSLHKITFSEIPKL